VVNDWLLLSFYLSDSLVLTHLKHKSKKRTEGANSVTARIALGSFAHKTIVHAATIKADVSKDNRDSSRFFYL